MQTERDHRNLRVLFLADGLAPFVLGGMQQHSTQLVKHMAPLVESITLVHCGQLNGVVPSSGEVLDELGNPDNVNVIGLPFTDRGLFPGHYLRASLRVSRSFCEAIGGKLNSYDAVYAQGLMGDAFLGKHPKVMVNLHGLNMFQRSFSLSDKSKKLLLKPIFRKQIRKAWRNVSLGGKLFAILEREGARRDSITEIPNGIDSSWILTEKERLERYNKRKDCNLRFVMIGRYDVVKGLHVLQAAMSLLQRPIELHMIGDWPIWESGIHRVIHHGVIRDKTKLMAIMDECDVLLIPSLSEGMPTVALEAMARGLHIIGADVGAMNSLRVKLFPPGDAQQLACAMSRSHLQLDTNNFPTEYTWGNVAQLTSKGLSD